MEELFIGLLIIIPGIILAWLVTLTILHFTQKNALKDRLSILEVEVRALKRLFDTLPKTGAAKPAAEEKARAAEAKPIATGPPVMPQAPAMPKPPIMPEPPPIPGLERPIAKDVRIPPPAGSPIPPLPPRPPAPKMPPTPPRPGVVSQKWQDFKANVDWELFAGIKLFAWLGGIALFFAAGFFVKYSIDRNLIPPALRLAVSALIGMGLIMGAFRFGRGRYEVLRHTLTACGIGVLYSVVFTATLYYRFLEKPAGFGLLTLVSAATFVLALYHRGVFISMLGALGAYLTPVLVNTGQGNLVMLFLYLSIVNAGLYYVVQKLQSAGLLLIATLGTAIVLALGSFTGPPETKALIIAGVWIGQMALFSVFLGWLKEKPDENGFVSWTGHFLYLSVLGAALGLMNRPGSGPLLLVAAGMAGAVGLALKERSWSGRVVPYGALAFLAAFLWTMLRFNPVTLSWSYGVILFYGAVGGLGPILVVEKYGLEPMQLRWFRIFPVALGLMILAIVLKNPFISFWFWPLILVLQLMTVLISLLFRALIQTVLLTLFFLVSGLTWVLRIPAGFIGPEFFGFLLLAGVLLSMAVFYAILKGPAWLEKRQAPGLFKTAWEVQKQFGEWITAMPGMGAFILLAVTFWVQKPFQPHLGMSTMVCFLALSLLLAKRLSAPALGVVSLLSSLLVQAVWIARPINEMNPGLFSSALVWSGLLFCTILIVPFPVFKPYEKWTRIWNACALFEVSQGLFLLWAADHIWPRSVSGWTPLILAFVKLPLIWLLMKQLQGRPERNSILAFHGGVLLFYVSAVPVLLLDQGWIGLTLVLEAALLLGLNRRVVHEGLRWTSMLMAPIGLLLLYFSLDVMKGPESPPLLNWAVGSVALTVAILAWAAAQADFPQRHLSGMDLPGYFRWLAVGSGFFLVNLMVADLFAGSSEPFKVFPEGDAAQMISYGLLWLASGAALWSVRRFSKAMRLSGIVLICLGAASIVGLPYLLPDFVPGLQPVLNLGLPAYLIALLILVFLFMREKPGDSGKWARNLFLAIGLIIGFMALKVEMNTVFQPGLDLRLFFGHTTSMAVASAFGWLAYGLGLLLWPKTMDRPFRIAGWILILLGLIKTISFPFAHAADFGAMAPLWNIPSLLFLFVLLMLTGLTLNRPQQHWPWERLRSRPFWGVLLAGMCFFILNVEISSLFAPRGQAFTLWTHGDLAHQLAYSLGWMVYSIGLLIVGIRWQEIRVRWAAMILLLVTVLKLAFMDIWRLGGLYIVASFAGLAVVGILFSFLYQRFFGKGNEDA